MFSAALRVLQIKDLKDLSVSFGRGYYRHAGPQNLKRRFFTRAIAGERPPRYGPGKGSPRHAPFGSRCSRTTVFCS